MAIRDIEDKEMEIKDFLTEKWMNIYERQARVNLTDTSCDSLSTRDLLALDPELFDDVTLDYGWIEGDPALRKEILSLYSDQNPSSLTTTHGALQANEMVMCMLLKPGDHVLTFRPGYQQFSDFPRWLGANVTEFDLDETDWSLDLDAFIEQITPQTRLVVFANPSNPTGTVLDEDQLKKLAAACGRHGTWILVDEVYRNPLDGEKSITDLYERGVATGSLSKQFGLAGLRLGWIKGAPSLIEAVNTFRDYTIISGGVLSEKIAALALHHKQTILARHLETIENNKQILKAWLDQSPWFSCILPSKGTVAFLKLPEGVESEAFCTKLLDETGIFFVPGSCFEKEGYVRLGLGKSHENLPQALEQLDQWTGRYLASLQSKPAQS